MLHPDAFALDVSIHAPVRGATATGFSAAIGWMFQSTPLYEGRRNCGVKLTDDAVFQSTPLYEGRLFQGPSTL